jgi:hypothetical protein
MTKIFNLLVYMPIAILLVFNTSCKNNKIDNKFVELNTQVATGIKIDPENISSDVDFFELVNDYVFIKLETERVKIRSIQHLELLNDSVIVVATDSYVHLFTTKGEFVQTLNKTGRGPNELDDISSIAVNPLEGIIYVCDSNKKLVAYKATGELLKSVRLSFYADDICVINNDLIGFKNRSNNQLGSFVAYNLHNSKVEYSALRLKNGERISATARAFYSNLQGEVLYTSPFRDTIFSVTDNNVYAKYSIERKGNKRNYELIASAQSEMEIIEYDKKNKIPNLYFFPIEDINHLAFNYSTWWNNSSVHVLHYKTSGQTLQLDYLKLGDARVHATSIFWNASKVYDNWLGFIYPVDLVGPKSIENTKVTRFSGRYTCIDQVKELTNATDNPIVILYRLKPVK